MGYHVMVACSETGKAIRTGIELPSLDAFDTAALARRTTICPHCGREHRWGKGDAWLDASGSGQLAAGEGRLTFNDLCKLPNGTPVQLLDGLTGRMTVWHKAQQAVGVIVPGEGLLRTLSAGQVRRRADGAYEEIGTEGAAPRP